MSDAPARLRLRVAAIADVAPRIRLFDLVHAEGAELPPFEAGAHLDIAIPGVEGRSYSLLNAPAECHRYRIAVLREPQGRGGSAWMHEAVRVGDILEASPPANHFPLAPAAASHLLIGGGIGITPLMAMAESLAAAGAEFHLHYCARAREEAGFADHLAARHGPRLSLYFDGGDPARGLDIATLLARKPPGGHVYVCGPAGMIRAVREAAREWPEGTVHWELFAADETVAPPPAPAGGFAVTLAKSGQTLQVPADRPLLDVLRENGVRVKTMCRDGVCGTCRVTVLSGEVEHRDQVLTKAQQAKFMQVCVSRAPPGATLVLDL